MVPTETIYGIMTSQGAYAEGEVGIHNRELIRRAKKSTSAPSDFRCTGDRVPMLGCGEGVRDVGRPVRSTSGARGSPDDAPGPPHPAQDEIHLEKLRRSSGTENDGFGGRSSLRLSWAVGLACQSRTGSSVS